MEMPKAKPLLFSVLCLLCLSSMVSFSTVKSQISLSLVSINADGSVDPSNAPIEVVGKVYTLTANISANMLVHRSNIVIDGDGYALLGNGGTGIDLTNNITQVPSPNAIWNVTIKNMAVLGFHFGINTNGGGNDTLYDDYVVTIMSDNAGAVSFWACSGNNVSYCNLIGETAIDMQLGSSLNTIMQNNIDGSVWVEIGGNELVDRNCWSDYFQVYPNATEIGGTGIGNTPYVFYFYSNTPSGLSETPLYDYHPQINLITTPLFLTDFASAAPELPAPAPFSQSTSQPTESPTPAPTPTAAVPELSWLAILPLLVSELSIALVFGHRKTTNSNQ
jgi:hypothetical protein